MKRICALVITALIAGVAAAQPTLPPPPGSRYVADFVATAANGIAMNDAGDVAGTSYPDPGCGPYCLPPQETVVWRGGKQRIVLPPAPGLTGIYVRGINAQGWVAGFAGFPNTLTHAVLWKPNGPTYQAIDLGVLPGTTSSYAVGIDDLGRVVGWSTTSDFPPNASPFMWSESTGMVDLALQGYPDEAPLAISPGGAVATPSTWYQLGNPASVVAMPPPPEGFAIGADPTAINDTGDQARFLVSTAGQRLHYLFRFHHLGTWQQISFTGVLTLYGIGSISAGEDVSATVGGAGVIAYGPEGVTQPLAGLLSTAYQAGGVTVGGPMNSAGQILAQIIIGRSARLMRMTPAQGCSTGCIRVADIRIFGKFIPDPANPGDCTPNAKNVVLVSLRVTDETGAGLSGVLVNGRFLDDYWTNRPVRGITNQQGTVPFVNQGLACVGAVTFLVDNARKGSSVLDRTTGVLSASVIPLP